MPEDPRAWLHTVASRRLIDAFRADGSRRDREQAAVAEEPSEPASPSEEDDSLTLLFLCCHPTLSAPSQLALTLRAAGGLRTAEIASAFLVPEPTMAQRISRAKGQIRKAGARFDPPPPSERGKRLAVVEQVIYLIFNEGYTASSGESLQRSELTREAIRLGRLLMRLVPAEAEVAGLLALMLLTDARRSARTREDGSIVPLADQDRALWDGATIEEGIELITGTLGTGAPGPYQLQAAIAAVHDEAPSDEATDWPQILALYGALERFAPSPVVTLNRAVALSRVDGPRAGLELLDSIAVEELRSHRFDAVRAHLLERTGAAAAAREHYLRAARKTDSLPEREYLTRKAAEIGSPGDVENGESAPTRD